MMIVYQVFVGIDIAARSFTASWTQNRRSFSPAQTFTQDPDGFARLERQLTATGVAPAETLLVLDTVRELYREHLPPPESQDAPPSSLDETSPEPSSDPPNNGTA